MNYEINYSIIQLFNYSIIQFYFPGKNHQPTLLPPVFYIVMSNRILTKNTKCNIK